MPDALWRPVDEALDRAARADRTVAIWLRDDDAVDVTPALQRLIATCEHHGMPILLAVIPEPAQERLAALLCVHPDVQPAQHGFRHTNHAPAGERARELGARPVADVYADLLQGRQRFDAVFGAPACRILVPPWNRIDADLVPSLPEWGFAALSTFGPAGPPIPNLVELNSDLDPIDWRRGRVCRPHVELVTRLARLIDARAERADPIGLLTHHLTHDESAWEFLDACLGRLRSHPAVRFLAAGALIVRARLS